MSKKILEKIRSLWRNKVQDTTKEWEESGEQLDDISLSKYSIVVKATFSKRLKFLLTNNLVYRLTSHQFRIIKRNPLHDK